MVFEFSFWWLLPAFLFATGVAFLKYNKLSKLPDIPWGVRFFVPFLRFCTVFLLFFLLLNPALSLLNNVKEKPLLIVAQDNSESIIKTKDSLYYRNDYKASLNRMFSQLENKYDPVLLNFGASVERGGEVDFAEKRTDIAGMMKYAALNFVTRKPVAMVLLTDGIYNSGINPRYQLPGFPLYIVALGDTVCYPDIYIRSLYADKFNFFRTIFPIKAEIVALKQKGVNIKCVLRENGNVIAEKNVAIDRDNFLTELFFEVEAKHKGMMRYSVTLETQSDERTRENNRTETWIHIIDNSANIAVVSESPHPDIAAIVNAVNVSGIYRCNVYRFDEISDTLRADLYILHNPDPENAAYQKLQRELAKRKSSVWHILTGRKNISDFARFERHYSTNFTDEMYEYVSPVVNRDFPYFEFTEEEISAYLSYPPLVVPFGGIQPGGGRMLFTQKMKHTATDYGMLGFYEQGGARIAYLWGDGLWRWRLYSYQEFGNHELFNTLINKIVGYLAVQKGNERFIHDIKPVYGETEETIVHAELYNDSYELVNTPDVNMQLTQKEKTFDYQLNRSERKYKINLGNLPSGEYSYCLSTNLKGEAFEKRGVFYVRSYNPEANDVVANRGLLDEMAKFSGGQLFEVGEMDYLVRILKENDQLKPVFRKEIEFVELNRMGILGLILLLLICTEWFLLKYFAD